MEKCLGICCNDCQGCTSYNAGYPTLPAHLNMAHSPRETGRKHAATMLGVVRVLMVVRQKHTSGGVFLTFMTVLSRKDTFLSRNVTVRECQKPVKTRE